MATATATQVGQPAAATVPWAGRSLGQVGRYVLLLLLLLLFLVPVLWVWLSAFKAAPEISRNPFGLPAEWRWENFVEAWNTGRFANYIGNSAIYCAAIVAGVTVLSCLAAYALSMLPLPGSNLVLVLFLLGLTVPFQSVMIPLYYQLRDFGLLESYWAFILPGIALRLPFGVFLLRGFFRGLPPELADAARTDGANEWRVFREVILPLAWPGLATTIVFQFMFTWNQFAMPLVFVQREELRPVATGIMFFFGRFTSQRDLIAAGVTIAMVPVVVLYLLLQRKFIEGITAGALKS